MFIEKTERPQGEVPTTGLKMRMSTAIRLGAALVPEAQTWSQCAIATALKAVGEYPATANFSHEFIEAAMRAFDLPESVVMEVNSMHTAGCIPRAQIADWLESKGY